MKCEHCDSTDAPRIHYWHCQSLADQTYTYTISYNRLESAYYLKSAGENKRYNTLLDIFRWLTITMDPGDTLYWKK